MSSLKAVLVQDYVGNSMLSVLDGTKTDPSLISGMLSAIDSFCKAVIGGGLRKFDADNGINILFDKFYFDKEINRGWTTYDHGFPFMEELMAIEGSDDYYLLSSVPKGFKSGKKCVFAEKLNNLGVVKKTIQVFDFESKEKPLFTCHYKPELKYSVSKVELLTNSVYYGVIYDKRDDSLLLPDKSNFVESKFKNLGGLLKNNVVMLGHSIHCSNTLDLDSRLKPLIQDFFVNYNKERTDLIGSDIFNDSYARMSELKDVKTVIKDMIDKLGELNSSLSRK